MQMWLLQGGCIAGLLAASCCGASTGLVASLNGNAALVLLRLETANGCAAIGQ